MNSDSILYILHVHFDYDDSDEDYYFTSEELLHNMIDHFLCNCADPFISIRRAPLDCSIV